MTCACPYTVKSAVSNTTMEQTSKHPCYSVNAHHQYARMHLPVAPQCNISCNYCNRKFDCLHESRPGVTSEILTPQEACAKFKFVKQKIDNLSVVGIAGPGDALANWQNTRRALELIRAEDPEVIFCLSTNGLMLSDYADQVVEMGINHVTVTLNCLEPEIGQHIYKYVNYRGKQYSGKQGAQLLLENQLMGIEQLTKSGVLVKINIVMLKGINDHHIPDVVQKVKGLGVFISNIMPLIPASGSAFEHYPQTSTKELNAMRDLCEMDLQQMRHCKQCRADAIGMLNDDRSLEFRMEVTTPEAVLDDVREGYTIAVASKQGRLIDQHFGHAEEFAIYQGFGRQFRLLEKRQIPKYCQGPEQCDQDQVKDRVAAMLSDCDAVLSLRMGYHAKQRLQSKGITSFEIYDTVENALEWVSTQLSKEAV